MPYPISKEAITKRTEANQIYKLQWLSVLRLKDESSSNGDFLESIDNDFICPVDNRTNNAAHGSECGIEKRHAML